MTTIRTVVGAVVGITHKEEITCNGIRRALKKSKNQQGVRTSKRGWNFLSMVVKR